MARHPEVVRRSRAGIRRVRPGVEALESRTVLSTLPPTAAALSVMDSDGDRPAVAGQLRLHQAGTNPSAPTTVNLGAVAGSRTIKGLGLEAGEDAWFRFRTVSTGHAANFVGAAFATDQGDLDVELYDARGHLVASSSKGRNMEDIILKGLKAGTYRLRVFSPEGEAQDHYNLVFRNPQKPVVGDRLDRSARNSTPARAFGLGRLTTTESLKNLSNGEGDDWFRFQAMTPGGSARIDFAHEAGDLDLELYRLAPGAAAAPGQLAVNRSSHLELVTRSAGLGDAERVGLPAAGTYFVRVYGYSGAFNASYRLTVEAGASGVSSASASALRSSALSAADSGDWFSQNLVSELSPLVSQLMTDDGQLSRADMLTVFSTVGQDGTVSSNEYQDLQTIVTNTSNVVMPAYVRNLSSKVVGSSLANALYQGQALGDLQANSPTSQLQDLVNKWFLGLDHPSSVPGDGDNHTYAYGSTPAAGTLFGATVQYSDVNQGLAGDCYLLSSLGTLALQTPDSIDDLIFANGDGTYTVQFYYDQQGVATPDYVTVDGYFPLYSSGEYADEFIFADSNYHQSDPSNVLWVPLVEKAYAQWSAEGHNGQIPKSAWTNSYFSISNSGGYADKTLAQLTGSFTYVDDDTSASSLAQAIAAFNAGGSVVFGSNSSLKDISYTGVVNGHDYAMVGYDSTTQLVTLFNPWGLAGGYNGDTFAPGLLHLTQAEVLANYSDIYFSDVTS